METERPPSILIVDDDPGAIRVLGAALAGEGCLTFATSGAEAIALVAAGEPDLLLLDAGMPERDGFDVCADLKAAHPTLPVVFVTASDDTASETRALAAGAVDFIHKPVSPPVVRARVRNHLELRRRSEQLRREVRERTRAEEELRRLNARLEALVAARTAEISRKAGELEALFASSSSGMALLEAAPPHRVIVHNRRFQDGYPEPFRTRGMVGHPLSDFDPALAAGEGASLLRGVSETGRPFHQAEFRHVAPSSGEVRWWDLSVSAVRTERTVVALALVNTDVTAAVLERQRAEAESRRVEEATRELESFSYTVSHDLRAPLRAVHGFTSLLALHLGEGLDAEGHRLLGKIERSGRRMGLLVDAILHYIRVRKVEVLRTQLDVTALARRVAQELLVGAPSPALEVRVGDLPGVRADGELVSDLLRFLLSNAIKFSAARESPRVEVGFEQTPRGTVYLVRDNGVGFDPRHADKLFGVFQRLHGEDEFEGVGIGLALVRRIVERHGGWVRADGEPDRGAVVRFTLEPAP